MTMPCAKHLMGGGGIHPPRASRINQVHLCQKTNVLQRVLTNVHLWVTSMMWSWSTKLCYHNFRLLYISNYCKNWAWMKQLTLSRSRCIVLIVCSNVYIYASKVSQYWLASKWGSWHYNVAYYAVTIFLIDGQKINTKYSHHIKHAITLWKFESRYHINCYN